jgi:hypothetical protein
MEVNTWKPPQLKHRGLFGLFFTLFIVIVSLRIELTRSHWVSPLCRRLSEPRSMDGSAIYRAMMLRHKLGCCRSRGLCRVRQEGEMPSSFHLLVTISFGGYIPTAWYHFICDLSPWFAILFNQFGHYHLNHQHTRLRPSACQPRTGVP